MEPVDRFGESARDTFANWLDETYSPSQEAALDGLLSGKTVAGRDGELEISFLPSPAKLRLYIWDTTAPIRVEVVVLCPADEIDSIRTVDADEHGARWNLGGRVIESVRTTAS